MFELNKSNIQDILPLTSLQAGMLYHYLLEKEGDAGSFSYNQQVCFKLVGQLDVRLFRQAWQLIIDRHDALRAIFKHDKTAEPIQIILKKRDCPIDVCDLTGLNEAEQAQRLALFLESDRLQAFELEKDLLVRPSVLKIAPETHWFVWSFHHICLDGWCVVSLQRELFIAYQQLLHDKPIALSPPPSLNQFLKWYKSQPNHEGFWRSYLSGFVTPTPPPLPTLQHLDSEKPATTNEAYATEILAIEGEQFESLSRLSSELGVTLSTLFHCLWGVYLAKVNETEDVVFGTVQSLRPLARSRFDQLVALCINTVPCRIRFEQQQSFADIARQVQSQLLDVAEHATSAVSDIQSQLSEAGQLFDHFIAFENYPSAGADENGREALTDKLYAEDFGEFMPTSYPFHLAVLPSKGALQVLFKYIPARVQRDNIQAIANSFSSLVARCLKGVNAPVKEHSLGIPLVAGAERPFMPISLYDFYQSQVKGEVALVQGERRITHQELELASLKLAHLIRRKLKGDAVIIYDTAHIETVVAMFACFRLGIPYIPVDPLTPPDIAQAILHEARAGLLLTTRQEEGALGKQIEWLTLDDTLWSRQEDVPPFPASPNAESIAYIIFTSGTSGRPKGVPVQHGALVNYVSWCQGRFGFSSKDSSLLLTSFFFDLGYTAMFGSLLSGGSLHIASEAQRREPLWVTDYLIKHRISFLKLTPSYLHMLLEVSGGTAFAHSRLEKLILGGEELNYQDLIQLRESSLDLQLFNHYGPTENTIGSCAHELTDEDLLSQRQNIGQPAENVEAFVLEQGMSSCPPYVEGELYLSGPQLLSSYLNPEDNQGRLLTHGDRVLYRSGDRAYQTLDGDIIFRGREQSSVKIDGYRVDLNVVQQVLKRYAGIRDCLVESFKRDDGSPMIVALLIPVEDQYIELQALRVWLGGILPHYMHPSDFIEVSRFPMTDNGKVNRKEVIYYWKSRLNLVSDNTYRAPVNSTERALQQIWQRLFLKERISTTTNFFELGGHSIKAIICFSEIQKALAVKLPVSLIFSYPTIAELATVVEELRTKKTTSSIIQQKIIPLYNAHKPMPTTFYCLPPVIGTSTLYKEIFEALSLPVQALGFQCGGFSAEAEPQSFMQLADDAASYIIQHHKQSHHDDKVVLLGYSFGAVLALEVAKRLETLGLELSLLLLDSHLDAAQLREGLTFNEMRNIKYWKRILDIFEKNLEQGELQRIERGVLHNQRLLRSYLQSGNIQALEISSPITCIEGSANAEQGYMKSFAGKTSGVCSVITTPGDHYSMFQPPNFSCLIRNIMHAVEQFQLPVGDCMEVS